MENNKQETLEPIVYNIGDNIRIINPTENQPKLFTTHKVDNNFGVVYYYQLDGIEESIGFSYIKQEEPKQELKVGDNTNFGIITDITEYSVCFGKNAKGVDIWYKKSSVVLKPKQETLEEAAERIRQESFMCCSLSKTIDYVTVGEREKTAFYKGAKWQQEQDKNKYSEEDMHKAYCAGSDFDMSCLKDEQYYMFKKWFEQFKKK